TRPPSQHLGFYMVLEFGYKQTCLIQERHRQVPKAGTPRVTKQSGMVADPQGRWQSPSRRGLAVNFRAHADSRFIPEGEHGPAVLVAPFQRVMRHEQRGVE